MEFNNYTPEIIIDTVSRVLVIDDLTNKSRKPVLAHGRIIAAILMRRNTKLSYAEIAQKLGVDKTSIYSFEKRFKRLLKDDHKVFRERWISVWNEGREICA